MLTPISGPRAADVEDYHDEGPADAGTEEVGDHDLVLIVDPVGLVIAPRAGGRV
jgi:hypothetical protein